MTARAARSSSRIVVLARANDVTAMVVNYLSDRFDEVVTVMERSESSITVARRRARRLGWTRVGGQLAFVGLALPVLEGRGRDRVGEILDEAKLDVTPVEDVRHVQSVNSPHCIALLQELAPAVVVVMGTRIISRAVLDAVDCPFVNTHAGITPRYRGMHGAYWALSEGRPDLVGTTVHLIDPGIDTGAALARTYFTPGPRDSIATYPYLHLVSGLPALAEQVQRLTKGEGPAPTSDPSASPPCAPVPGHDAGESRLWWHPTLWGYLVRRWRAGVR